MKKFFLGAMVAIAVLVSSCSAPSGGVSDVSITPSAGSASFSTGKAITAITFAKTPADATGTFSISPDLPAGLNFDTKSGTISGTPTAITASKTYKVSFTGSGDYAGKSAEADIVIEVITSFSISPSSKSKAFVEGIAITAITFTKTPADATGTFSVSPNLPAGLNFAEASGTISGTPTAETASKTYTVSFTGSGDYAGKSAEAEVTIEVIAFSIKSPSSHYTFGKNTAIDPIAFTKDPADATGTFSISPDLPAGLNFDTKSGTISGTPTAITASKTYKVSFTGSGDYAGKSAVAEVTIKVIAFSIKSPSSHYTFGKNTAIDPIAFTKDPADATGTFSISPDLPAGLNFDKAGGKISGTPTAITASKTYTVSFTGSGEYAGKTAEAEVTIEVITFSISPSSNSETFLTGTAITAVTFTKNPAGVIGTFSVSPALPAGLSFTEASGKISGTPTAVTASKSYTLSFAGSGKYTGLTGTADITIQVNAGTLSGVFATLEAGTDGTLGNTDDLLSFGRAPGAAGTAPTLVSVTGTSSGGTAAPATLSGGKISGAASFLTAVGNGGTITVNMTVNAVQYANTYTYYTLDNSTITANRIILNGSGKNFSFTGMGHEASVIAATIVIGSGRTDTIVVTGSALQVSGTAGANTITGGANADTLVGGTEDDTINGGGGKDTLNGNLGADILTGGADVDTFLYSTVGAGGDTITDFVAGTDKLYIFGTGRLITGTKAGNAFQAFGGTGTATDKAVVESKAAAALTKAQAEGMFESTNSDDAKMVLASGNSVIFVRQDDNTAAGQGTPYDAQIFHVANSSGTITATLMATLNDSNAATSITAAFADFE